MNNWQDTLAELISSLPEDQRQRAHDFFVGYIAAMQEEVKKHEENLLFQPLCLAMRKIHYLFIVFLLKLNIG
jgi:hypothetical protein